LCPDLDGGFLFLDSVKNERLKQRSAANGE